MDQIILIADAFLILLLIILFFYGMRILKALRVFNNSKEEMRRLVLDVSGQITKAEAAVKTLKQNAEKTASNLEKQVGQAQSLSDELGFICETADNLASRLEKLSEGKSESSDKTSRPSSKKSVKSESVSAPTPMFAIRDPEHESNLKEDPDLDEEWDGPEAIETKAERQLFKALKEKKARN